MHRKIKYILLPLLLLIFSCSQDENNVISNEDNEITITQEILKLVNEHRKSLNKPMISFNTTATKLAENHTNYMITKSKISHDNFSLRFKELQQKVNAKSAGENVASGYSSAKSVMNGWLSSSGHKANIEGNFTYIGIAAIKNSKGKYYFTQLFYR